MIILLNIFDINFYLLIYKKMNLKELKQAFIILKSQKLIDFYDIEIEKNEN
jgi:hypothetical protein